MCASAYPRKSETCRSRGREMIWAAYFMLALESLVIALSLWIMWAMISEASRVPASTVAGASAGTQRRRLVSWRRRGLPRSVHPRGSRRAGLCEHQEAPHGLRGGRLLDSFRGQDRRWERFSDRTAVRLGLCQRPAGREGSCLRRVQHSPNGRHHRGRGFWAWLLSGSRTPRLPPQVEVHRRRANGEDLKHSPPSRR
jgi:hypothetical protein